MDITADAAATDSALDKQEDAGKGVAGEVKRWNMEIELAGRTEAKWRERGEEVVEQYRSTDKENTFNILWSNVEVLRPNIYNSTPKPDVRRRYADPDPVAKTASEILKRGLSFQVDTYDFDDIIDSTIIDMLLPGRGNARVRYKPQFMTKGEGDTAYESLADATTPCEYVPWRDFRRGAGKTWDDVPWIAYRHLMTREEFEQEFKIKDVKPDIRVDSCDEETAEKEPDLFKRITVWEVWDKKARKIRWLSPSVKDRYLLVENDKLKLRNFFDCPRPLYAIKTTGTLVPKDEYSYYENQAKELDRVTTRINKLMNGLKLRGVYDATMEEVSQLLRAGDNEMIAAGTANIAMKEGGLDRAFWFMPIEQVARVLAQLYTQRDQIRATIYEIMGIADIMRGSSDANETLGAQQLKAQTGSVRMRHRQKEVQRFIRDLFEIMAEIMAEHFTPEILTSMTGIPVDKQVMALLKNDVARNFRIDIETNSTVAGDRQAEKDSIVEMITGIGSFVQSMTPAVEAGVIPIEAAKEIMMAAIRRFEFGSAVEDAIENAGQQAQQQQPDPAQQAAAAEAQAQAQAEQQRLMAEQQAKAAELQARREESAAKNQLELRKIEGSEAIEAEKLKIEQAKLLLQERELEMKAVEMRLRAKEAATRDNQKGKTP